MDYKVISHIEPSSIITEAYRNLRTNLGFLTFDEEIKIINVTSSMPGEGKTLSILNLATVMAQNNKKVILVDLDLRKPKLHRAIDERNINGVSECVSEGLTISECIKKTKYGFDCMVAGKKVPFPSEFLGSKRVLTLIEELKKGYDYILIDCPPVNVVTDANIVSRFCDGTLFVVRNNTTDKRIAKKAINSLKEIDVNVLGSVITRVRKKDSRYGQYSYYGEKYSD